MRSVCGNKPLILFDSPLGFVQRKVDGPGHMNGFGYMLIDTYPHLNAVHHDIEAAEVDCARAACAN